MRTLTFAVLRQLADGEFHSGQALACRLNVSRASIWGALNEAQAAGLQVQRMHGRGYRLSEPLDWLDESRIESAVAHAGLRVRVVNCCASTNAVMLHEAEHGVPSGRVLAAEVQTQGRGRLGRAWHSGLASALTFSLLWRFDKPVAALAGLSLAIGTAIVRALRGEQVQAQLKWPNDLLWAGRKLGGILIEIRGDALGPCAAVIGVGLNVRLGERERRRIDQPAADLYEAGGRGLSRNDWLARILLELAAVSTQFGLHGFASMREEWNSYHAYRGRSVRLAMPDGSEQHGTALDVDEQGCLLLSTPAGIGRVVSGDVSLRVAP